MLAVPDKFGRQKKEEYERKHGESSSTITPLLDLQTSARPTDTASASHYQGLVRG